MQLEFPHPGVSLGQGRTRVPGRSRLPLRRTLSCVLLLIAGCDQTTDVVFPRSPSSRQADIERTKSLALFAMRIAARSFVKPVWQIFQCWRLLCSRYPTYLSKPKIGMQVNPKSIQGSLDQVPPSIALSCSSSRTAAHQAGARQAPACSHWQRLWQRR